MRGGGKVVKNVAGYDLPKLFIGSFGTLGVIVEATVKLRPRPDADHLVAARFDGSRTRARRCARSWRSDLIPSALDLRRRRRAARARTRRARRAALLVGFDGVAEQVAWQETEQARCSAPPGHRARRRRARRAVARAAASCARRAFAHATAVMRGACCRARWRT